MPPFLLAMVPWLITILTPLVGRVLAAFGFGFVIYEGITVASTAILQLVESRFSGLPAGIAQGIGMIGLDQVASIYLSAWVSVLAIKSLTGVIKRLVPVTST